MFKKVCLWLVLLWFGIQVGLWGLLVYHISKATAFKNIQQINNHLRAIQDITHWQNLTGLGTYHLPYVAEVSQTVRVGTETGLLLTSVMSRAQTLGVSLLAGNETDWQTIESLLTEAEAIQSQLNLFTIALENPRMQTIGRLFHQEQQLVTLRNRLQRGYEAISQMTALRSSFPALLGFNGAHHVVVLTQNNMELWPTGGYLGSYAEFYVERGALKYLQFQDIGVPNGQIKGYVAAPLPISKYVHQGGTPGWRLRESNWNPDFPESMKTIEWFFTEGGVKPIDTLVAINLIPVVDLLRLVEPLQIDDYQLSITHTNFYQETQLRTSYGFFDGSTQKRDFLSAFGKQLVTTLLERADGSGTQMVSTVINNLNRKQIMLATKEPVLATFLHHVGWDGSLSQPPCPPDQPNCLADYLHINETNMGINKTNCCISRSVSDHITVLPELIRHTVTLHYTNHNPAKPQPPASWGGGYKVYERFYVPLGSTLISITENGQPIDKSTIDISTYTDKQVFGFLGLVEGGLSGTYEVTYEVPLRGTGPYTLRLLKQSGIDVIPWTITISQNGNSQTRQFQLEHDLWIK